MFEDQPGLPDQTKLEADLLRFWQDRDIFAKLRARNRGGPRFSFLDGPITANNPMGVHHAWGRTLKDIFQRYWAMRGRDQRYQNGFDCQGLWVEVEVERELGFSSKRDIEHYGVAEFVARCKERVARFADTITTESIRLGCWMDWPNSYYTLSDQNNYAIWHFLQQCHRRGLVYPGTDVMPWCPRCGTGLSQQEIQEGYRDVVHPGLIVKFPLRGRDREFLLVWTTTPWTLTANVACAVNPNATYAKIRQGDDTYYLAAARASEILTSDPASHLVGELPGRDLLGLPYSGPFDDLPLARPAAPVHCTIPWTDVSEAEGTGVVHIAPGCGKEDYDLGRAHDLPSLVPIDENGRMLPDLGPFAGKPASDLAPEIIASLRARALLYRVDDHLHRYPHCWRCGSELLFRLVDEWFVAMDPWRDEIKAVAEQVNWLPAWGRDVELDWLRNMRDWMISKKRYWGLALPIWRCHCGWFDVIGSRDELRRRAADGWDDFDGHSPHRPWVDAVKVPCAMCGALASRIPDVGNPWLDAGIVAYSTMGYFEDRDEWRRWFPADLIVESLPGQFRLWFYSLLAMSTMLQAQPPVRTIMGYDLVLDEHGDEMHKSKGNAIWFSEAADAVGADPVRWISAAQPLTHPLRFGFSAADDVRAWLRTLWNVYHFLATYANVDGWPSPGDPPPDQAAPPTIPLDRWLRARTADAAQSLAGALESLDTPNATAVSLALLDDLSNWWVRRSRRRFWKSQSDADKQSAYASLWTALHTFARLLAPFLPFTSEALHQRLASPFGDQLPESVHLCPFPAPEPDLADRALLDECSLARRIVRLGRAARADAGLRVRQPLARAFVLHPPQTAGHPLPNFEHDVLEELNVKRLDFVADRDALGPASAEEADLAVGLDTHLTDDLLHEGIARDLVRHIQNLRKRAGLRVDQHIALWVRTDGPIADALRIHHDSIAAETLAAEIDRDAPPPDAPTAQCRVAGHRIAIALLPEE